MHFRHFVTTAALGYIAWALTDHSIWSDSAALEALWHPDRPWLLGILFAGLPLNIALETAKWHALIANGDKSWSTSLREVLIGATFAMVTPNRTGDAVARVALLPPAQLLEDTHRKVRTRDEELAGGRRGGGGGGRVGRRFTHARVVSARLGGRVLLVQLGARRRIEREQPHRLGAHEHL